MNSVNIPFTWQPINPGSDLSLPRAYKTKVFSGLKERNELEASLIKQGFVASSVTPVQLTPNSLIKPNPIDVYALHTGLDNSAAFGILKSVNVICTYGTHIRFYSNCLVFSICRNINLLNYWLAYQSNSEMKHRLKPEFDHDAVLHSQISKPESSYQLWKLVGPRTGVTINHKLSDRRIDLHL